MMTIQIIFILLKSRFDDNFIFTPKSELYLFFDIDNLTEKAAINYD